MSALLLRPNGDYYIIEVVKKLSRNMPTEVTSNPVETGESVSDHVILNNKTWTLDCVISDATPRWLDDNSLEPKRLQDANVSYINGSSSNSVSVTREQHPSNSTINVKTNRPGVGTGVGGDQSLTSRLKSAAGNQLGFITQFFKRPIKVDVTQSGSQGKPNDVTVTVSGSSTPAKVTVETFSSGKVSAFDKYQLLERIRDNREVLTFIHSSGTYENIIITDVQPSRDSTISVYSFVFTLNLEQIQVVDKAKSVAIAKLPKPAPKPKTAAAVDTCTGKAQAGKATPTPQGSTQNGSGYPGPSNPTLLERMVEVFGVD